MNREPIFRSRAGLIVMIAAGVLLVAGLFQSAPQPQPRDGPSGSSYATHDSGTAALATLLERNGFEVSRTRTPVAELPPAPQDVVVLVNGGILDRDDVRALNDFIASGGRFIAIDSRLDGIVANTPDRPTNTSTEASSLLSVGPFAAVETTTPVRVWPAAGSLLPLVGNEDGTLVGIDTSRGGAVVAVADSSVVENGRLGDGDHALLAIQMIGETEGTVRFLEYVHGFTRPTGLSALPARWKQGLLVASLAGVVWLVARGKRFGPVEKTARDLPPPRSAYVDAIAATLATGADPEVAATLDRAIERELNRRGVAAGSPEAVERAVRSGAGRETAELALSTTGSEAVMAAKSVLLSHLVNKEKL
jgi:hypothetical protein